MYSKSNILNTILNLLLSFWKYLLIVGSTWDSRLAEVLFCCDIIPIFYLINIVIKQICRHGRYEKGKHKSRWTDAHVFEWPFHELVSGFFSEYEYVSPGWI